MMMMAGLTLKLHTKTLGNYRLQRNASLTIGRRENNNVVIDDPAVSGHHAKIESLDNRFVLIDLQSKNGSFVNEQLINSHWLKHGDVINIGGYALIFTYDAGEQMLMDDSDKFDETAVMNSTQHRRMMIKSNPHKSINVVRFWDKSQNRGMVKENVPKVSASLADEKKREPLVVLTYLAGGNGRIKLTRKITTIGKHPTSDIVVKGLLIDETAVTINKRSDGFYLNYIGGLPRPKVNNKTVKKSTLLTHLDIIEIGSTKLQFSTGSSGK